MRQHFVRVDLVLSSHFMEQTQKELRVMNINDATLFPGLDGYARSLRTFSRMIDFRVFPADRDAFAWGLSQRPK
jgi:hypothetical protein